MAERRRRLEGSWKMVEGGKEFVRIIIEKDYSEKYVFCGVVLILKVL